MKNIILTAQLILFVIEGVFSQFAPPAGVPGSTAIHKDSDVFVNWAQKVDVHRGYVDISDKSLGYVDYGEEDYALGKADGKVISLGDSGSVVIHLNNPIVNGSSWDFAVFENGFSDEFLELAFVEVSTDGEHYFRFPAASLTDTLEQTGTFGTLDARKLNNLAGKYRVNYGTPFDLDSLEDNDFLDKNNVKFIKIVDVIGSLDNNYATFDSKGNKVNDPFPTPFNTGGFDLDAVGIIHQKNIDNTTNLYSTNAILYPNPASDFLMIDAPFSVEEIVVISLNGKIVYKEKSFKTTIDISSLTEGNYIVVLHGKNTILTKKLFKL